MLRARWTQCSRVVASMSSAHSASLHTSAVLGAQAQVHNVNVRGKGRANIEKQRELKEHALANRPHIVLGYRPGDEAKWLNSDLAKVIVTPEEAAATPPPPVSPKSGRDLYEPRFYNYGIGEKEKEILFDTLPALTLEGTLEAQKGEIRGDPKLMAKAYHEAEAKEIKKTAMLARLVDLRNADARGVAYENRRRIVTAFSTPENPADTGRPEVQAALLTLKIRNVWAHVTKYKKDTAGRRNLRILVHKRAKILKYLKRLDLDRYELALERLGLEPASVEGELVV